jgi:hypothetical protein
MRSVLYAYIYLYACIGSLTPLPHRAYTCVREQQRDTRVVTNRRDMHTHHTSLRVPGLPQ